MKNLTLKDLIAIIGSSYSSEKQHKMIRDALQQGRAAVEAREAQLKAKKPTQQS